VRKSTFLCLVTFASGVNPLARKQFSLVRKLTILLSPLAIIRHEIFAKVILHIMCLLHLLLLIGSAAPGCFPGEPLSIVQTALLTVLVIPPRLTAGSILT
jgi:hypothetical protein